LLVSLRASYQTALTRPVTVDVQPRQELAFGAAVIVDEDGAAPVRRRVEVLVRMFVSRSARRQTST
jgi:hypothetical protein